MTPEKRLEQVQARIESLAVRRQAHKNWSGIVNRSKTSAHFTGIHRELDELYEEKRQLISQIENGAVLYDLRRGEHHLVAEQYCGAFCWPGLWESAIEKAGATRNGKSLRK